MSALSTQELLLDIQDETDRDPSNKKFPSHVCSSSEKTASLRGRSTTKPQNSDPQKDKFIGQYFLEKRLGQGGMAEVFSAIHSGAAGFERTVCLKRILPSLSNDLEFRDLFIKEAKVAGKLCHSNLVHVFDCIEDGDTLAIVMEMIDGMDLRKLVKTCNKRGKTIPHSVVAYIAGQILSGLRYAHEQKVIHRDISPHNVLLSVAGEVKITDFGVAKAMLSQATRTGNLKGKIAYMSPEQASAQTIDYRTDLYSAGLVIYEMLAGRRFFKRTSQSELLAIVTQAKKPKLTDVDPRLAFLVEKLLEPNPNDRFQSAQEALSVMPPWMSIGPVGADELAQLVREMKEAPVEQQPAENSPSPWPYTPKNQSDDVKNQSESQKKPANHEKHAARTEILPDSKKKQRRDRPVIPGPANAPTATRDMDVKLAIAFAPTEEMSAFVEKSEVKPQKKPDQSMFETHTGLIARYVEPKKPTKSKGPVTQVFEGLEYYLTRMTPVKLILCAAAFALIFGMLIGASGRLLCSQVDDEPQAVETTYEKGDLTPVPPHPRPSPSAAPLRSTVERGDSDVE